MASLHPLVQEALDALMIQFPDKAYLSMKEYASLYGIQARYASIHLRRHGIPASKEGRRLYVNILDVAKYKARCKTGPNTLMLAPKTQEDIDNRRGYAAKALQKKLWG